MELNGRLINEDNRSWKDDCTSISNYIKYFDLQKIIDYARMPLTLTGSSCNTINYACAYVCAPQLVQLIMNALLDYCLDK